MPKIHELVDSIVHYKKTSQHELAEKSGINSSNLSKFLNGETDIRISNLERILSGLDISIEGFLENEVEKLQGKSQEEKSIGSAIELLLNEADPIVAKTFIDSLSSRVNRKDNRNINSALDVVNNYKAKLKNKRGNK